MKLRSRLKHVAASLLQSLISRNNDLEGYWAPGLLYRDVSTSPYVMELDLLTGGSLPPGARAGCVARSFGVYLRAALVKQGFAWGDLDLASVTFQFNASVPDPHFLYPCSGDPFICTVRLRTVLGPAATISRRARCYPYRHGRFCQRAAP